MKNGDKIYKYLSFNGFGTYVVTAIIERENVMLYEVECQVCSHGSEKCRLLVAPQKEGTFKFCSMVNEDESDPQYMWHNDDIFYSDLNKAKIAKYEQTIQEKNVEIEKHQKAIESLEIQRDELSQHLDNIRNL